MTSDPAKGPTNGPPNDIDPAESHSGEGLASVRPRLARTLAASAKRTHDKQMDAMASCPPPDAPPAEPEPPQAEPQ